MPSTSQYEEPLSHACEFFLRKKSSLLTLPIDGSPDVFGRHHHNNGDTVFDSYERDGKQQISMIFFSDIPVM